MTDASKAVARYDGPRSIDDLRTYSQLLAVNTNPEGQSWRNDALPATFRGNPAAVAFAVEYAKALDVSPVTAIMGVHMIDGKLSASSGLISALIRRAGHKMRTWTEGTIDGGDFVAITTVTRADDPDFEYRSEWTLSRAVRAGLMKRAPNGNLVASKPRSGWDSYPENMAKARSITECARDSAEDAILGVHYTPEELGHDVDDTGEPVYTVTQVRETPQAPAPETSQAAQSDDVPASQGDDGTPAPPVDLVALADELRGEILAAPTSEDLAAIWTRRELTGAKTKALPCGDANGTETNVYDLFVATGKRLREAEAEPVEVEVVETPADPPADATPPVEETVVEEPTPPAAMIPDVDRIASAMTALSIPQARAELDKVMKTLETGHQAQVIEWARAQGMNPAHSAGNCAAIVKAIADGDPFTDEALTRMISGEDGTEDPVALVTRLLGAVVVEEDRADDRADAASATAATGGGQRRDNVHTRTAAIREKMRRDVAAARGEK